MHELALGDSSEKRKRLYQALLASTLIVPTPELPDGFRPGLKPSQTNTQLQMVAMNDKQGRKVTPAFTDVEALQNWDPNTPSLSLKAQALFQFAMEAGIQEVVINPFDPIRKMIRPGGTIRRAEFELLSKGVVPTRIGPKGVQFQLKAHEKVAVEAPAGQLSTGLEETLRKAALGHSDISALFLFRMVTANSAHDVIGVQLCKVIRLEKSEEIIRGLGESAQPKLKEGESLDFLVLKGDLGDQVKARGAVIFRRS